ncbi:MAG: hypothetical protein K6T94_22575 [Paenibacillus sp.]|nr:hypothetical protein [Paenibacillus sp.]
MGWKEWIMQSSATYWVQVGISLLALSISIRALVISRRTQISSVKTVLKPTFIGFRSNNPEYLVMTLHNTGPGRAFEVKVTAHEKTGFEVRRYFIHGTWVENKAVLGVGKHAIQPNEEETYLFKKIDTFHFHYHRPIRISYELANGDNINTYWYYKMGTSEVTKFVPLSSISILIYRFFGKMFIDRIAKRQN